jgi:hypothetical protein
MPDGIPTRHGIPCDMLAMCPTGPELGIPVLTCSGHSCWQVRKDYLAVCAGRAPSDVFSIDLPIVTTSRVQRCAPEGRRAIRVLRGTPGYNLGYSGVYSRALSGTRCAPEGRLQFGSLYVAPVARSMLHHIVQGFIMWHVACAVQAAVARHFGAWRAVGADWSPGAACQGSPAGTPTLPYAE